MRDVKCMHPCTYNLTKSKFKWIEREYQADDVSIQMYFRMELDKVTHVKNSYADCDKLVQLLENCANEDSFRFYMEDEDSTQWLNLFDALPEEFKTELEYSGRPPNLTNLLDFLTIKMKYLQKRKILFFLTYHIMK